jgi:hypothetical protein
MNLQLLQDATARLGTLMFCSSCGKQIFVATSGTLVVAAIQRSPRRLSKPFGSREQGQARIVCSFDFHSLEN